MASYFFTSDTRREGVGLAIVRILTGIVFMMHGGQKLFQMGIPGVTAGFTQMGVPMPGITAPLVTIVEFAGGFALVIGLLTRLAALGLAIDMLGAIFLVHLAGGFFLPAGYEFALMLFAACLALVIGGAGRFSVDDAIARRRAAVVVTRNP